MKTLWAAAAVGLALTTSIGSASAQWGGGYYRDRDYGYEERRYRDRDYYDDRRGRGRAVFSEREYLSCHPDVARAVRRGEMESGWAHYRRHGRREGRNLSC
jgi:hypothetical protein